MYGRWSSNAAGPSAQAMSRSRPPRPWSNCADERRDQRGDACQARSVEFRCGEQTHAQGVSATGEIIRRADLKRWPRRSDREQRQPERKPEPRRAPPEERAAIEQSHPEGLPPPNDTRPLQRTIRSCPGGALRAATIRPATKNARAPWSPHGRGEVGPGPSLLSLRRSRRWRCWPSAACLSRQCLEGHEHSVEQPVEACCHCARVSSPNISSAMRRPRRSAMRQTRSPSRSRRTALRLIVRAVDLPTQQAALFQHREVLRHERSIENQQVAQLGGGDARDRASSATARSRTPRSIRTVRTASPLSSPAS